MDWSSSAIAATTVRIILAPLSTDHGHHACMHPLGLGDGVKATSSILTYKYISYKKTTQTTTHNTTPSKTRKQNKTGQQLYIIRPATNKFTTINPN